MPRLSLSVALWALSVLCIAAGTVAHAVPWPYRVVAIGDDPNVADYAAILGLNNKGEVIGYKNDNVSNIVFFWRDGMFTEIKPTKPLFSPFPQVLNDAGTVVVVNAASG